MHFHELVRLVHVHHYVRPPELARRDSEDELSLALDNEWPESAVRLIAERGVPAELRFDAVLVDEGQDFSVAYAELVQRVLPEHGSELVIAHDLAQQVYGRESVLSDHSHPWSRIRPRRLRQGARLSHQAAAAANLFATRWKLPTEPIEGRHGGLLSEDDGPHVTVASDQADAAARALQIVVGWREGPYHRAGDVAVLVPSREFGMALVRLFAEHGISTNHVFPIRRTGAELEIPVDEPGPDWIVERTHKDAFSADDSRLKVSTIHSFKGWEAPSVVFVAPSPRREVDARTAASVYVGITRARGQAVFVTEQGAFALDDLSLPTLEVEAPASVAERFSVLLKEVQLSRRVKRGSRHDMPGGPLSGEAE